MKRNALKKRAPVDPPDRFFVNTWIEANYTTRPGQKDTLVRVPAAGFIGKLRRIPPRLVPYMIDAQLIKAR